VVSPLQVFQPKYCTHFSSLPFVLHVHSLYINYQWKYLVITLENYRRTVK
jgi:hypothetical protein